MRLWISLWMAAGCSGGGGEEKDERPHTGQDDPAVDSDSGQDTGDTDDTDDTDDTAPPLDCAPIRSVPPERSCAVRIVHSPGDGTAEMAFAADFTGWQPLEMAGPDAEGRFCVDVEPGAGEFAYKFVVDGVWEETIPPEVPTHWDGDVENRNLVVGDCLLPTMEVVFVTASPGNSTDLILQFVRGEGGPVVDPDSVLIAWNGVSVQGNVAPGPGTISVSIEGLPLGKHTLEVGAADVAGNAIENGPLDVPIWVEETPFEWTDGLMYFAMVDRFRNGDWDTVGVCDPVDGVEATANYNGGDFLGILHAMEEEYFDELGTGVLWISPVGENPHGAYIARDGVHQFSGFHGYWPASEMGVETCFGDSVADADARLRELVAAAHARGIRVMFDMVLNHVHEDHPWVTEHPDWFHQDSCTCGEDGCDWEERKIDCEFMPYLPDFDYRNHDAVEAMVENVLWWVREYDVDALRLDAVKHMTDSVVRNLRRRLGEALEHPGSPTVLLMGETFTGGDGHAEINSFIGEGRLHGQYDFPLYWSIRTAFLHGGSFVDLDAAAQAGRAAWGNAIMSPFAGNHDVMRLATELVGNGEGAWGNTPDLLADGSASITQEDLVEELLQPLAFTLTQPGLPLLYYGDEIGLAGDEDPDNRRMMNFDPYLSGNQGRMLAGTRRIANARQLSRAIRRSQPTTVLVDADLYIYKFEDDLGEEAIVAIHKGSGTRTERVPVSMADGLGFWDVMDLNRTVLASGGEVEISLTDSEFSIYLPTSVQ